jgi:putative addiction module killer protein
MIEISEYHREDDSSPFADWFNSLNPLAAAKVTTYLLPIENGNTSSLKSVGEGVFESRNNWGPGYRIYLGQEGQKLVILLGGGTKKSNKRI